MKDKLFPLFITSLGLFTAYIFYAVWQSEEVNPSPVEPFKPKYADTNLSNKKLTPKTSHTVSSSPSGLSKKIEVSSTEEQMHEEEPEIL